MKGYCAKGSSCTELHSLDCQTYLKTGYCQQKELKKCPLRHSRKLRLSLGSKKRKQRLEEKRLEATRVKESVETDRSLLPSFAVQPIPTSPHPNTGDHSDDEDMTSSDDGDGSGYDDYEDDSDDMASSDDDEGDEVGEMAWFESDEEEEEEGGDEEEGEEEGEYYDFGDGLEEEEDWNGEDGEEEEVGGGLEMHE